MCPVAALYAVLCRILFALWPHFMVRYAAFYVPCGRTLCCAMPHFMCPVAALYGALCRILFALWPHFMVRYAAF
jgi:hypothetical protein